jgi:hypothetical protein
LILFELNDKLISIFMRFKGKINNEKIKRAYYDKSNGGYYQLSILEYFVLYDGNCTIFELLQQYHKRH